MNKQHLQWQSEASKSIDESSIRVWVQARAVKHTKIMHNVRTSVLTILLIIGLTGGKHSGNPAGMKSSARNYSQNVYQNCFSGRNLNWNPKTWISIISIILFSLRTGSEQKTGTSVLWEVLLKVLKYVLPSAVVSRNTNRNWKRNVVQNQKSRPDIKEALAPEIA